MKILFIHRRGVGQFEHLAANLASAGNEVTLITESVDRRLPGVRIVRHRAEPPATLAAIRTSPLATTEHHVRIGLRVAETLDALVRAEGPPDMVVGHIGWGSMMFVKDVVPRAPALGYCEFFYRAEGADVGFDPEDVIDLDVRQRLRLRNAAQLVTLDAIDAGISPTGWQRSRYPENYARRIAVCHDGIDVHRFRPDNRHGLTLPDGRVIKPGDPVVTFAARDLEPYRGFPQAAKAAERVLARHKDAIFVFVGGDSNSYGASRRDGKSWKDAVLEETPLDPARVFFPGQVPHETLTRLFQISAAHIYLTYPFVLSWSVLEAMSCGALVIGSETAPVQEVIRHGQNGLLVPFFEPEAIAETVLDVLARPQAFADMRRQARQTIIERYALDRCLSRQRSIMAQMFGASMRSVAAAG
ncbi:glycosyl transferase [Kaistia sp. 32K]|uniref:glycosyltransferase family 4 protein n=1 Tax=Kaistia sp. 32K TaxID=2795690 RepID=UPI0019164492|nr:glycosyltransferase family 4 protein [Kaistia sp. 32K]BCP53270.1 glycosyl transferase [Kaistia sp. 32K]